MIYGHIHNNTGADYWPLIAARDQMLNAGVDINGFAPATLDELIENNRRFKEEHACTITCALFGSIRETVEVLKTFGHYCLRQEAGDCLS